MDERWVEVETRLAFQEEAVDKLNRVVAEQGLAIGQLRIQLTELAARLRQLAESSTQVGGEEPPPPHY
jgi:SlyX protein